MLHKALNVESRESTQGAKGSATLKEDQQYELTSNPLNYVYLVAYVAEDGLVSLQREESHLVLWR